MKLAQSTDLRGGGILLRSSTTGALAADRQRMLDRLELLDLRHCVDVVQPSLPQHDGVESAFRVRPRLAQCWAPGFDTLGPKINFRQGLRKPKKGPYLCTPLRQEAGRA